LLLIYVHILSMITKPKLCGTVFNTVPHSFGLLGPFLTQITSGL